MVGMKPGGGGERSVDNKTLLKRVPQGKKKGGKETEISPGNAAGKGHNILSTGEKKKRHREAMGLGEEQVPDICLKHSPSLGEGARVKRTIVRGTL